MNWVQITVTTSQLAAEAIANLLFELDALGVEIQDVGGPTTSLIAYYPLDDRINTRVKKIQVLLSKLPTWGIPTQPAKIELKNVESEEWTEAWKSSFQPLEIGERVLVAPTWYQISDTERRFVIRIDPGMAFGTGHHPTTRLSLEMLEQTVQPNQKVADIGTGSGVLAIAAIKLGAEHVDAIELDPTAILVAEENIKINEVTRQIDLYQADGIKEFKQRYHLIVSNILTKAILPIIPHCPSRLFTGGHIIFSGILESELDQVQDVLVENGLRCVKVTRETEGDVMWTAILARFLS